MSDLPMTPKNMALNYAKVNDFQVETFRIDGRTMYKAYGAAGIAEAQNYDRLLTKMRQLVDVATVAECTAPDARQKEKIARWSVPGVSFGEGAERFIRSFAKPEAGPWTVTLNGTSIQAKHSRAEAVKAVRRMLSGPNGFLYTDAHKLLIVYAR
jgi:hypothetical protein